LSEVPANPKIYHIVHYDRLASIIKAGYLFSDKESQSNELPGTNIGMDRIKGRRMMNLVNSHSGLRVGECVPFYFCPRSIMLFIINCRNNPDLNYTDGQDNIIHLEADLYQSILWAEGKSLRWAFTLSNAGANYFEDRASIEQLKDINWKAVKADRWSGAGVDSGIKEGKQAEFLVESKFSWELISSIGVIDSRVATKVQKLLFAANHEPTVNIRSDWYY
jgi:hypothetical protein